MPYKCRDMYWNGGVSFIRFFFLKLIFLLLYKIPRQLNWMIYVTISASFDIESSSPSRISFKLVNVEKECLRELMHPTCLKIRYYNESYFLISFMSTVFVKVSSPLSAFRIYCCGKTGNDPAVKTHITRLTEN